MSLIFLKKSKKSISSILVLSLIFQLTFPLTTVAHTNGISSSGGGNPVASALSSMVDGYTGDFRYSVPLATLPGPNGENVSISASYHAGIAVNQKSSWVGLGWDYNPGEITRQVVGAPDDFNGRVVTEINNLYTTNSFDYTLMFGSLYNNNINGNGNGYASGFQHKSGDNKQMIYNLSASERCNIIGQPNGASSSCYDQYFDPTANASYRFSKHTVPYTGLAYDQYSVSGEGIGGTMRPQYLGDIQIHKQISPNNTTSPISTKKCQFYFENSSAQNISRTDAATSSLVNTTTNRVHSSTYVKYYTNAEINNNTNLYSNTSNTGYIDYKPVTNTAIVRRPTPDHDPDAIGAFEITDASGMTYHYSLPVYSLNEVNMLWETNYHHIDYIDNNYASSWKLTAITGADYQDVNGNFTVDEGDSGYWIGYNYSLWSDNYYWASQRYSAKSDAMMSTKVMNYITSSAVGNEYKRRTSLSFGHTQVYALNYIKTASHTAYFVKSIRMDEQSYDNLFDRVDINGNPYHTNPTPLLKLDRVVVLRNEDKNLLINTTSLGSGDMDNRFSYATCSQALSDLNFINITRYTANKTAIDQVALTTAELITDYSLAKKYHGNINNTFTINGGYNYPLFNVYLDGLTYPTIKYLNGIYNTSNTPSNNGKLTLKKINIYNLNGQKIIPSIDFGYDETNPIKNPDFNIDKTDLWGYYKSDYVNSHYVTYVSKDDVDAWSLKEINTSLGGKINITYESDKYDREGFDGDIPFYEVVSNYTMGTPISSNIPHLIFPIHQIDANQKITFEDADFSPFYHLVNEPTPLSSLSKMFLVYGTTDHCSYSAISYNGGNSSFTPPPIKRLVRHGVELTQNNPASSYSATSPMGPYNYFTVGQQAEFDLSPQCTATNGTFGYEYSPIGVNHVVCFRPYLYGGGVRVKQLTITDPFSSTSYNQTFEYGSGYCPIVPVPTAFSTDNGPSNHDVVANIKPLIAPQLTGLVGYSTCTQHSDNALGESVGTSTQTFYNSTITNPLSLAYAPTMTKQTGDANLIAIPVYNNGTCSPLAAGLATWTDYFVNINLQLKTDGIKFLGKPIMVDNDNESSQIIYNYTPYFIQEQYVHYTTEVDVGPTHAIVYNRDAYHNPCQSLWTYTNKDHYNYGPSSFYNYDYFVSTTIRKKDGIYISENVIDRDPYTATPLHTKTIDPTKGVYDNYTTLAYQELIPGGTTLAYPSFNLKSINETNRNVLNLSSHSSVVKANKYVINESKVNYSNSYPIRAFNTTTNKYEVSNITKPWYHLNESYERLLDDDVLATTAPVSTGWRKLSTNTLYDTEHNNIEQEGLNGRKTASKWGYSNRYKLASIANANFNSFTFSGFEDPFTIPSTSLHHFGGEVTHGEAAQSVWVDNKLVLQNGVWITVPSIISPHTGFKFAKVEQNTEGPTFFTTNFDVGRTYIAKVWVHNSSPATAAITIRLDGNVGISHVNITKTITKADATNVTVGNWTLMSTEIDVPANFNTLVSHQMLVYVSNVAGTGTAYFDDFSFHPKDAVITGNVYNEKTGLLIAQLDNDNFATLYNYDNAARLISSYKEYSGGVKKISESTYHYAKP